MKGSIKSFKDLDTWKEGHKLVISIYKLVKKLPKDETFGLTSQMKRAVVSITSNIAEVFGRPSYKDKSHFYQIAFGSIIELRNQLLIAKDVGYINSTEYIENEEQAEKVERICRGLIKKSQEFYS